MDKIKKKIKELTDINRANPILTQYIENVTTLECGQLCRTAEFKKNPDIFYLITEVEEKSCKVIPGSFDAYMAGVNDIILPRNVTGNFVFLSLDLVAEIKREAIGKIFAKLDEQTYNRIIDSVIEYASLPREAAQKNSME